MTGHHVIASTAIDASSPEWPRAAAALRRDYWATMWKAPVLHLVHQIVTQGLAIAMAIVTAATAQQALAGTITTHQIVTAVLVIGASAVIGPAVFFWRNWVLTANAYDHELVFLRHYLNLCPTHAAKIPVGEVPDRLVIDLVKYRFCMLWLAEAPVAVAM